MDKKIKQILNTLGLSDKEIMMYLYGLENGPRQVSQIAKSCALTRTNAYDVANKLMEKGLCRNLGSLYGKKIEMASPGELKELVLIKQKELIELSTNLDSIIPHMRSETPRGKFQNSRVTYFEGQEGLRKLFLLTLQSKEKEIRVAMSETKTIKLLGDDFSHAYIKERTRRGIKVKALRVKGETSKDAFYSRDKSSNRASRYLPASFNMDTTVHIYDNSVSFVSVKNDSLGVLIESSDYTNTMKSWFDYIWKSVK